MERCASLGSLHKLELEQHGDWRDKWATECSDWQRLITGIKNVDVGSVAADPYAPSKAVLGRAPRSRQRDGGLIAMPSAASVEHHPDASYE